jgi:hypothetical protein
MAHISPIVSSILDDLVFFLAFVPEYRRIVISSLARSPHLAISTESLITTHHSFSSPHRSSTRNRKCSTAVLLSASPLASPSLIFLWKHAKICTLLSTYYPSHFTNFVIFSLCLLFISLIQGIKTRHYSHLSIFITKISSISLKNGLPSNICSSRRTHRNHPQISLHLL